MLGMKRMFTPSIKTSHFNYYAFTCLLVLLIMFLSSSDSIISNIFPFFINNYQRRSECRCVRPKLPPVISRSQFSKNNSQAMLCSPYATRRGPNQRVIAISLFGPKENKMFQLNISLSFLHELINDVNTIYSDGYILRIYHDNTISAQNVICPIECKYPNVDFCSIKDKLYIPPKIWRFIPAADPLVDIMMSRDLDSALTLRERAAVDVWLASNKSFHSMRDHPMHGVPMLGGMWGFRPSLNRSLSRLLFNKIHDPKLVMRYTGRGDQTFLTSHVWPYAKLSSVVHDSFLCKRGFGSIPEPFPTQRPAAIEWNCFVGCVRPCCGRGKMPFGECPKECRPKDHLEWKFC